MEFRQLEYFCTISELENFTRTAEVLHVSQPSVTKAIKALEAELGLTLIDRSQKHVTLTAEGRAFLIHAQRIMQDAEAAKQDMLRFRTDTRGTVHFGVPPMVEAYLFPDFFTKFHQTFPDISLDVQEYNDSDEIRERAELGELDFGIVLGGEEEQGTNELLIFEDNMSLCLHPQHPLSGCDAVDFHDLRDEHFILQQPRTYQNREVTTRCNQAGFTPDVVLCTSQLKTIKQLVANNMGISILPDFVTRSDVDFLRKPLNPPMHARVSLYWSGRKVFSIIDKRFRDFMESYRDNPYAQAPHA